MSRTQTLEQAQQANAGANGADELDLSWLKFEAFDELPEQEAEIVIEGLLHIGEKLGITAGSKSFKTWLLLYLGYCIANGFDFLGFKTKKAKVAFFDLELSRNGLRRRLERIRRELGKGDFENIKVCSLRGKASKFCRNFDKLFSQIKAERFKVVIIDPVYKFLLGKEESSNGIVADVLEKLTVFCMEAQVALVYVHHHSKGNQASKDSLDRSSGAGAWSRDPDAVLDLTEHEESTKQEKIYKAEITVREFPPIENFVVRWAFPLLTRDTEGLDPEKLKQPTKGGRPKSDANEKVIIALRTAELYGQLPGLKVGQIVTAAGIPRRTVYRAISELNGRVLKCVLVKGFQLSPQERAKVSDNQNEDEPGTE
jgi:RecA-family ATPase